MLTRLLQMSKPKLAGKRKNTTVFLNSISAGSGLKLLKLDLNPLQIDALADTGSTHCLITADSFSKIPGTNFLPVQLNMKVAGHTLKDNIVGATSLPVKFHTSADEYIVIVLDFLIAKVLNGYDAIIGADMLMNKKMLHAITPDSIILTEHYKSKCIPLHDQQAAQVQPNFISVVSNVRLPADTKKEINISVALPCQNSVIGMADKLQTEMQLHSLNAHRYTLSHPHINTAGQLTCVLQNHSLDDLHFDGRTVIATAELNATSMHSQESGEDDSLDDQIIDKIRFSTPWLWTRNFPKRIARSIPT
jgi:hypothetical protein